MNSYYHQYAIIYYIFQYARTVEPRVLAPATQDQDLEEGVSLAYKRTKDWIAIS